MREALLKKRLGIPAALLIVLLLCGTALAWYGFENQSSGTDVQESLSTKHEEGFSTICPDENDNWSFDILCTRNVIVKWIEANHR